MAGTPAPIPICRCSARCRALSMSTARDRGLATICCPPAILFRSRCSWHAARMPRRATAGCWPWSGARVKTAAISRCSTPPTSKPVPWRWCSSAIAYPTAFTAIGSVRPEPCHSGMRHRSAIADLRRRPGIHIPDRGYGLRARSPRNDSERLILPDEAAMAVTLFASAAIGMMVMAYDALRGRAIKVLGAGAVVLFAALGAYVTLLDNSLSGSAVKLMVDAGVFAISLTSLAIRKPFTLQYAREMVDAETAQLPGFLRANYIITWAWTAAFLLMMIANVLMIYLPGLPLWSGLVIAFAARNSAVYFTKWYPQHRRAKHAASANALP